MGSGWEHLWSTTLPEKTPGVLRAVVVGRHRKLAEASGGKSTGIYATYAEFRREGGRLCWTRGTLCASAEWKCGEWRLEDGSSVKSLPDSQDRVRLFDYEYARRIGWKPEDEPGF